MGVVDACFKALEKDCPRIGLTLKADWKPGRESRLKSKVEHVEKEIGRKLRTCGRRRHSRSAKHDRETRARG